MVLALADSLGIRKRISHPVLGLMIILAMLAGPPSQTLAGCTDQYLVENNTTAPPTVGQSWTATCGGTLQSITVKADTPNAGLMTLKIYNGQSHAAPDLLSTQTGLPALVNGENTYAVGGVAIVAGQQYTWLFTNESANGINFRYDVANGYAGGMATAGAGFVAGSDIWFKAVIGDVGGVDPDGDGSGGSGGGGCFIKALGE